MSQRLFWRWLLRNKEWAWMSRRPAHLLVELLIGHEVRVQCPDPVADLVQLVLVVGARDQDEPLDRDTERGWPRSRPEVPHRRIRHLHSHYVAAPFAAAPGPGAPVITACRLAAPQAMCTGASRSTPAATCSLTSPGTSAVTGHVLFSHASLSRVICHGA